MNMLACVCVVWQNALCQNISEVQYGMSYTRAKAVSLALLYTHMTGPSQPGVVMKIRLPEPQ